MMGLRRCALAPFLLLSALAHMTASAQETAEETPPAEPSSALLRMTLVPADIERSVAFYRDVLGYKVGFDGDITQPLNRILLGLKDTESVRFVTLRGSKEIDGVALDSAGIGLMAIAGRDAIPVLPQPDENSFASGQAMMAIVTDDIEAVIARARSFGAPILVGPIEADTRRGREREIVLLDPDNTRIHVVQLLSAAEGTGQ